MRTILAHATGGKFPTTPGAVDVIKNIGFLNFGHWSTSPQSQVQTASDALLQSIDLAVAAEEVGADGAYFRVHHFDRQLASPFPLLAAIGQRSTRLEIGTGDIDISHETTPQTTNRKSIA